MTINFEPNKDSYSVDEIIAHPVECIGLPERSLPVNIVLLIEYVEPGSDNHPGRPRLATISNEGATPWVVIGMCEFAKAMEANSVLRPEDGDGD